MALVGGGQAWCACTGLLRYETQAVAARELMSALSRRGEHPSLGSCHVIR